MSAPAFGVGRAWMRGTPRANCCRRPPGAARKTRRGYGQARSTMPSVTRLYPTNEFKDKYIAPEMSAFTSATIRDMSEAQKPWLTSFILNSGLVVAMDDDTWRTFYN